MPTPAEIEAQLTGRGAPFEIVEEPVLGEVMPVFKDRDRSLREILAGSAGRGDAEYIVSGDRRISFAQHERVAASVARGLTEHFGVGPGDRVAILAANCPEWIVSFWGAVSLGAIPVGLNGWWSGDEIRYGVADCEPTVLIGDRKRLARVERGELGVPVVEIEGEFEKLWHHDLAAPLPDHPIQEDDAATILYTSGTTGRPKGAVNTHRGIIGLLRIQVFHGLRAAMLAANHGASAAATPTMLINTPLFHVSGLYAGAVSLLANGVKTVWTEGRFDPVAVMQLVERERVTNWGPMGTMLYRVVHHPDVDRYDLSSLTHVGSGGAPMSRELQERVRQVFPNVRKNMGLGYGLTEGTALATIISGDDLEAHPDSVGRPLPTISLEIRDEEGRALAPGEEGEVFLRSPLNMKEYWRKPEATAETLLPGRWLRTGDIGSVDAEGRLTINSRKRDLILRGGENVYPVEIEHALESHPDVREAAAIGVASAEFGQEVKAVVVGVDGTTPDPETLRSWVSERLAYFKVPTHWDVRSEPLPRNATGKIMKHLLEAGAASPFVEE